MARGTAIDSRPSTRRGVSCQDPTLENRNLPSAPASLAGLSQAGKLVHVPGLKGAEEVPVATRTLHQRQNAHRPRRDPKKKNSSEEEGSPKVGAAHFRECIRNRPA